MATWALYFKYISIFAQPQVSLISACEKFVGSTEAHYFNSSKNLIGKKVKVLTVSSLLCSLKDRWGWP
jgi:hypothetical protein